MSRPPSKIREQVHRRASGRCEAAVPRCCTGHWEHLHHKKLRSQGGEHTEANLLAVCLRCHEYIHAHPAESYDNGWLLHSWERAS